METLQDYSARGGYRGLESALRSGPEAIVEAVAQAGLQGRGGAGFPAGRKWRLTRESPVETRYLVANGGEDEPGSFKDRYLMEHYPHLVLEGALIAAWSIGARHVFLYVNRTFDSSRTSLAHAISELEAAGLLPGPQVGLELFDAPECYVAGEDTAVLEVLEGKPPVPRKKPPYPVQSGYRQSPTVVHNVETLANIPFIAREGAESYRRIGTTESPGTMLFYLNEEFTYPGVYELPFGTPLRRLVEQLGGGLKSGCKIKAILPGGPSTAFLPADRVDLPLDHQSLREAGSLLGCGNVRLIPEGRCMVDAALETAKFFARESCGKCPQCRMETSAFVTILNKILAGNATAALLAQLENIAAFSREKGDCGLIHMAAAPVLSAVKHFSDDFAAHLEGRACGASD